jgi:hypothetical protein
MTARRIFAAPLAVGLISGVGLLAALLGDNLWDALSWATLGLPVVLVAVLLVRAVRQ